MKNKKLFSTAICTTLASFFLFSCSSQDEILNGENDGNIAIEEFLLSNNEQSVNFNINYEVTFGYKITFEVYSENPYSIDNLGNITKSSIKPIMSALTDDNGDYKILRKLPGGVKEVYIISDCAGVPAILYGAIVNGEVTPNPFEFDLSNIGISSSRSKAFSYTKLGNWNSLGKPDYIDDKVNFSLSSNEYKSISSILREKSKVDKKYTSQSSIFVENDTEIWLSIVSDKSSYNNSISYYCYNNSVEKNNIKEIIAFPSTKTYSLLNGINCGDYIKLKYMDPVTGKMSTTFPAGTNIGFVLRTNAFNNGTVNSGNSQYYLNSSWNEEKSNKNHCAVFKTPNNNIIIGFEDMNNDGPFGNNDCNDILVHFKSSSSNAIDNIPQINDDKDDIIVEETTKAVRPLSDIIESAKNDKALKDLFIYTKSKFRTVNGSVVRVNDEIYVGSRNDIKRVLYSDFSNLIDYIKTNVFVSVFDFFSRADDTKKPHLMRTTVKEMGTGDEVDESKSRATVVLLGNDVCPADVVKELIYKHKEELANGTCIKFSMYVEFEPESYNDFVKTIEIPPYTPFIVNK